MDPVHERPSIGWHNDPTGRYRYRWFDGEAWSAEVSDGRTVSADRRVVVIGPRRRLGASLVPLIPGFVLLAMIVLALR